MENAENTAVLAMNFAVIGLLLKKVLKNKAMATTTKINAMMNRTRERSEIIASNCMRTVWSSMRRS